MAATLRAVRRHRRLRTAEVAAAMGLPQRSYEHFEAGAGRLHLDKLELFARATDSDPFALLAAILLRCPELAVLTSDNKFLTIVNLALLDLVERAPEVIPRLEAASLIAGFSEILEKLCDDVRTRERLAQAWLTQRGGPPDPEDEP
ncbi:helix-turn-helix domain-containing protein [Phenylobacterium deserti]|uniref:helix-turn-helix domain-containing protein n=1 Tax=Phenylobacterium deserti TaxID=1914756 RepID=UPI0010576AE6|nr:helix-turn-helix domain-containing protein [Phenylobacterium deserti]